jgi:hypothetical protein
MTECSCSHSEFYNKILYRPVFNNRYNDKAIICFAQNYFQNNNRKKDIVNGKDFVSKAITWSSFLFSYIK